MNLNASSMGRVYQHFESEEPFCVLTSDNTDVLEQELEEDGYGFIDLIGVWTDSTGKTWEERSYFIPNMGLQEGLRIGKEHNQLAIIYGNKGQWWLYSIDGTIISKGVNFDVLNIITDKATDYSKLPKQPERAFAFAAALNYLLNASSNVGLLIEQAVREHKVFEFYYTGRGWRKIEPYVYGVTTSGQVAIMGFQLMGWSDTVGDTTLTYAKTVGWRNFFIDAITSPKVTSEVFEVRPDYKGAGKAFSEVYENVEYVGY